MLKKKQIVFFCATTPYVEIYKIAKEFKKKNYETVLITISQKDKWDENFYKDAFDKIICSNFQVFKPTPKNLVNMIRRFPYLIKSIFQMKKLNPYIIFDIARPNYIAAMFMKFFQKYPLIYFPADISSHLHSTMEEALKSGKKMYEIKAERYCFENADGVLYKCAPEGIDHLYKKNMLGGPLKLPENILCFNPYCSDEFIVPINKDKLSKKEGELHFVYVGSFYGSKEYMDIYIRFFEELIKQNIHVHLYVKTHHLSIAEDKKNISPVIEYFKDNKYLHLNFAVPPKELIKDISKYDWGIFVEPLVPGSKEHKYTIGNKISTYLEAGLPFVYTSSYKFVNKIMKKYNLDFPVNTRTFKDIEKFIAQLKKFDYEELERRVIQARKNFNLNKQMVRLEKFIDKVSDTTILTEHHNLYK